MTQLSNSDLIMRVRDALTLDYEDSKILGARIIVLDDRGNVKILEPTKVRGTDVTDLLNPCPGCLDLVLFSECKTDHELGPLCDICAADSELLAVL